MPDDVRGELVQGFIPYLVFDPTPRTSRRRPPSGRSWLASSRFRPRGEALDLGPVCGMMYIHHMAKMVRKQVYITAPQERRLRALAARERRTEAEIIREALDRYASAPSSIRVVRADDALFEIVGLVRSADPTLSASIDRVVYGLPTE